MGDSHREAIPRPARLKAKPGRPEEANAPISNEKEWDFSTEYDISGAQYSALPNKYRTKGSRRKRQLRTSKSTEFDRAPALSDTFPGPSNKHTVSKHKRSKMLGPGRAQAAWEPVDKTINSKIPPSEQEREQVPVPRADMDLFDAESPLPWISDSQNSPRAPPPVGLLPSGSHESDGISRLGKGLLVPVRRNRAKRKLQAPKPTPAAIPIVSPYLKPVGPFNVPRALMDKVCGERLVITIRMSQVPQPICCVDFSPADSLADLRLQLRKEGHLLPNRYLFVQDGSSGTGRHDGDRAAVPRRREPHLLAANFVPSLYIRSRTTDVNVFSGLLHEKEKLRKKQRRARPVGTDVDTAGGSSPSATGDTSPSPYPSYTHPTLTLANAHTPPQPFPLPSPSVSPSLSQRLEDIMLRVWRQQVQLRTRLAKLDRQLDAALGASVRVGGGEGGGIDAGWNGSGGGSGTGCNSNINGPHSQSPSLSMDTPTTNRAGVGANGDAAGWIDLTTPSARTGEGWVRVDDCLLTELQTEHMVVSLFLRHRQGLVRARRQAHAQARAQTRARAHAHAHAGAGSTRSRLQLEAGGPAGVGVGAGAGLGMGAWGARPHTAPGQERRSPSRAEVAAQAQAPALAEPSGLVTSQPDEVEIERGPQSQSQSLLLLDPSSASRPCTADPDADSAAAAAAASASAGEWGLWGGGGLAPSGTDDAPIPSPAEAVAAAAATPAPAHTPVRPTAALAGTGAGAGAGHRYHRSDFSSSRSHHHANGGGGTPAQRAAHAQRIGRGGGRPGRGGRGGKGGGDKVYRGPGPGAGGAGPGYRGGLGGGGKGMSPHMSKLVAEKEGAVLTHRMRELAAEGATAIQRICRGVLARKQVRVRRQSATAIQARLRGNEDRRLVGAMRRGEDRESVWRHAPVTSASLRKAVNDKRESLERIGDTLQLEMRAKEAQLEASVLSRQVSQGLAQSTINAYTKEEQDEASTVIQSKFRQRQATVRVQEERHTRHKRTEAATRIQSHARRSQAVRSTRNLRAERTQRASMATRIQAQARRGQAVKRVKNAKVKKEQQSRMATRIQAQARRSQAVKRVNSVKLEKEEQANMATRIQAQARRSQAVKRVNSVKLEKEEQANMATRIQAQARRSQAVKRVNSVKLEKEEQANMATRIQAQARRGQAVKRVNSLRAEQLSERSMERDQTQRQSAVKLQAWTRGRHSRKKLGLDPMSGSGAGADMGGGSSDTRALYEQKKREYEEAQHRETLLHRSATTIQTWIRKRLRLRRREKVREGEEQAAVRVQAMVRGSMTRHGVKSQRKLVEDQHSGAVKIQSVYRGSSIRSKVAEKRMGGRAQLNRTGTSRQGKKKKKIGKKALSNEQAPLGWEDEEIGSWWEAGIGVAQYRDLLAKQAGNLGHIGHGGPVQDVPLFVGLYTVDSVSFDVAVGPTSSTLENLAVRVEATTGQTLVEKVVGRAEWADIIDADLSTLSRFDTALLSEKLATKLLCEGGGGGGEVLAHQVVLQANSNRTLAHRTCIKLNHIYFMASVYHTPFRAVQVDLYSPVTCELLSNVYSLEHVASACGAMKEGNRHHILSILVRSLVVDVDDNGVVRLLLISKSQRLLRFGCKFDGTPYMLTVWEEADRSVRFDALCNTTLRMLEGFRLEREEVYRCFGMHLSELTIQQRAAAVDKMREFMCVQVVGGEKRLVYAQEEEEVSEDSVSDRPDGPDSSSPFNPGTRYSGSATHSNHHGDHHHHHQADMKQRQTVLLEVLSMLTAAEKAASSTGEEGGEGEGKAGGAHIPDAMDVVDLAPQIYVTTRQLCAVPTCVKLFHGGSSLVVTLSPDGFEESSLELQPEDLECLGFGRLESLGRRELGRLCAKIVESIDLQPLEEEGGGGWGVHHHLLVFVRRSGRGGEEEGGEGAVGRWFHPRLDPACATGAAA